MPNTLDREREIWEHNRALAISRNHIGNWYWRRIFAEFNPPVNYFILPTPEELLEEDHGRYSGEQLEPRFLSGSIPCIQ